MKPKLIVLLIGFFLLLIAFFLFLVDAMEPTFSSMQVTLLFDGIPFWTVGSILSVIVMIWNWLYPGDWRDEDEESHGVPIRSQVSQEVGTVQQGAETEQKAQPSGAKEADAEALYDELLDKYIMHWGVGSGSELLDNEIRAYMRAGASFGEAVNRVYKRQQKNPY